VSAVRVPWSGPSFLAYLGGVTVFGATIGLLGVEEAARGAGGFVLAAALVLVVVCLLAWAAARTGHGITAGLLSVTCVAAVVVLLGALFDWFGWLANFDHPFRGFRVSILVLELATVIAAAVALRMFQFPLLAFVIAGGVWFFLTDLLSGGGNGSAAVTLVVGIALLISALGLDAHGARTYAFWPHVVAGLTLGGGWLWFFHDGDLDWILVGLAAVLYITLGDALLRSSWIVLGGWGLLQATAHFAAKWADLTAFFYLFPFAALNFDGYPRHYDDPWLAPLVFAALGLAFIGLGLLFARRRRESVAGPALL
jgi:LPXTG-motif cell wall-anchored protein